MYSDNPIYLMHCSSGGIQFQVTSSKLLFCFLGNFFPCYMKWSSVIGWKLPPKLRNPSAWGEEKQLNTAAHTLNLLVVTKNSLLTTNSKHILWIQGRFSSRTASIKKKTSCDNSNKNEQWHTGITCEMWNAGDQKGENFSFSYQVFFSLSRISLHQLFSRSSLPSTYILFQFLN